MNPRDEIFSRSIRIARPAEDVFAWHERPGALERLCPPWEKIEVVSAGGGIRGGAPVVIRAKVGPVWSTWRVEHRDYIGGTQFRDVLLSGPFAKWEHLHEIKADGADACVLTDTIAYRLPFGKIGAAFGARLTRQKLARLFAWRHATTRADLECTGDGGNPPRLRVAIAGASGLIGKALVPFLQTQGHEVLRLVRGRSAREGEVFWNPSTHELDATHLEGVDAIINLAGENVAGGRWTKSRRDRIFRSRVDAAQTLVSALGKLQKKPGVLINAAAIGYYGDCGDAVVTERNRLGSGFLPEVCLAWETHAEGAARLGVRTVLMRFGVVLSPAGGALAKMLPVFRAGAGGRLGSGRQWMSWIGIDDLIGAISHALFTPDCAGPINVVAPNPVTNAEFTRTLGKVLHRPALVPVPAGMLRLIFGRMADETILIGTRADSSKLEALGYLFRHRELIDALRHVLGRDEQV